MIMLLNALFIEKNDSLNYMERAMTTPIFIRAQMRFSINSNTQFSTHVYVYKQVYFPDL